MKIQEFRQQYPQYSGFSDDTIARKLHTKHYADVDYDEFATRFGVMPTPAEMVSERAKEITATKEAIAAGEDVRVGKIEVPSFMEQLPGGFAGAFARPIKPPQDTYVEDLKKIYREPGTTEQREEKAKVRTRARLGERINEIQAMAQDPITRRRLQENEENLKGKFFAKNYRRWERGEIMVVGGGLYLADTISKLSVPGMLFGDGVRDTVSDWSRLMHRALQEPEMQPVIENVVDKYLGGAVETGPFLGAAIGSAALSGGATLPAAISGFLVAYGVEGNNIYQTNLDQGRSERESRMRGIVGGLINGGIEVAGGGGTKYLKAARLSTLTKLNKAKYFSRRVLHTALREGLAEEMPQELVGMVLGGDPPRNPDGSIDYYATASRLIDAGIMGTILGGAIDAPMSFHAITKLPKLDKGVEIDVGGGRTAVPGVVYTEANIIAKEPGNAVNLWVKRDKTSSNKGRTLLMQFAGSRNSTWTGSISKNIPNSDLYEIHDVAEAKVFLAKSGYDHIVFNALESDRKNIENLTRDFKGQTSISGDIGLNFFEPLPTTVLYHGTKTDISTLQKEGITAQSPTYSISATDDYKTAKTYGNVARVVIPDTVKILDLTTDESETTAVAGGFPFGEFYDPSSEDPITRKQQLVGLDKLSDKQKKWLKDRGLSGVRFPQTTIGMPGQGTETRFVDPIPAKWVEPYATDTIKTIPGDIKVYNTIRAMAKDRGLEYKSGQDEDLLGIMEEPSEKVALMNATNVSVELNKKYTPDQIEACYREWALTDQGRFEFWQTPPRLPRRTTSEAFDRLLLSDSPITTDIMKEVLSETGITEQEAIGAELGLTPVQVQDKLAGAEKRYHMLENKAADKRSKADRNELAFLSRHRGDIDAIVTDYISAKPVVRGLWKKPTKGELLRRGHAIPEQMNMSDGERRDLQETITGKSSMAEMSEDELIKWVDFLDTELAAKGGAYRDPGPAVLPQLIERLKAVAKTPATKIIATGITGKTIDYYRKTKRLIGNLWADLKRIERWIEALDGYEEGLLYQHIWKPVKKADETRNVNIGDKQTRFFSMLGNQGIDTALWIGAKETIRDGLELTPFQQIGVHLLAQNKKGFKYLTKGMAITKEDIKLVEDKLTEEQLAVADWFDWHYRTQWPIIRAIAVEAGVDPKLLEQELNYSPILRTGLAEGEDVDYVSLLTQQFNTDSLDPEQGFLEKRKERAIGKIELDASIIYMKNVQRTETFKAMAPVAKDIGRILNNPAFKKALNNATEKRGAKIMNTWLRDTIRGFMSGSQTHHAKMIAVMRRNGIIYAIGYNAPSALRQPLSLSNAIAVDPLMRKYVAANFHMAITDYGELKKFVDERTDLRSTREYDRDLRKGWDTSALGKRLKREATKPGFKKWWAKPWSEKATEWIKTMDDHTVAIAWKSLYEVALEKNMDEEAAIAYADKWVTRTQPMANMKDLPHFFRGGTLERLVSTFQNQINNNLNFYVHDIIGARMAGKINNKEVMWRVTFSYVFPALVFGVIGRGGLPKDEEGRITLGGVGKGFALDLTTYPIATLMLVGRLINRMIKGWGNSSTIGEIAPEEAVKFVKAARRGDIGGMIKRAASTIGAASGRIPAQAIRTTEGLIDIAAGTTQNPIRRLIYSQWALDQGKPTSSAEQRRGSQGIKIRRPKTKKSKVKRPG